MEIEVPLEVKSDRNKILLKFLKPLSCHGDIIEPIFNILKREHGVKFFCPDPKNFKYCFWYIENSIFAFGSGMHNIGLLLPEKLNVEALSDGAVESKKLGGNWVIFPFNHVELAKWVSLSLASAKSS